MGDDPVDSLCDPAIQWDQRFMEQGQKKKCSGAGAGALFNQSVLPPSVATPAGVPEASAVCVVVSATCAVSHGFV